MSTFDDVAALEAWREGDESAGQALLRHHFERLYLFFSNKVSGDVSDLVQRTMMACVEGRDRIASCASFRSYLLGIARHLLIERYRKERSLPVQQVTEMSVADLATSPIDVVARSRDTRLLLGALRSIPLDLQIVLELVYWEELSSAELASALDAPLGTAKSRVRRAREKLSEAIARLQAEGSPHSTSDDLERWVRSIRGEIAFRPSG
ncbi:MAG: sigma-70 family RNA polymerase sigma factor [Deltaproteobacteria bacterium]|nr:sigma-70 family RNA polymerase sigma factor [Deltaproteobacteria bacterium]